MKTSSDRKRFMMRYRGVISAIVTGLCVLVGTMMFANYQNTRSVDLLKSAMKQEMEIFQTNHIQAVNKLEAGISQDNKRRWEVIGVEKVIEHVNPKLKYETRYLYASHMVDQAGKYDNLPVELFAALGAHESRFRVGAESVVGARGLFQIMPATGKGIIAPAMGIPYDRSQLSTPAINIKMAAWYISQTIANEATGNVEYDIMLGLAEYNGGLFGRNCYKYWLKYKDTDDYKNHTKSELATMVAQYRRDGWNDTDTATDDENAQYRHIHQLWYAKALLSETAHYIPDIMKRYKRYVEVVKNSKSTHQITPFNDETKVLGELK
jgi:hypothetical protein